MNTIELLSHLRSLGISLHAEGNRLQIDAPKGALTPELYERLAHCKPEILTFLHNSAKLMRSDLPSIEPIPRDHAIPLSLAQVRLWFLDQLTPGSAAYVIPMVARLRGNLRLAALQQSLSEIVRRHEVLRTIFSDTEGIPNQIILPPAPVLVPVTELGSLPIDKRELEANRMAAAAMQEPFDLKKGPLLRAKLVRLDDEISILMIAIHHIVFDGWSIGIFWSEFSALYRSFCVNAPSPLSEMPVQYADFAHWQRQFFEGAARESHLSYWRQQLAGNLPYLNLPTDRPRQNIQTSHGSKRIMHLGSASIDSLKALCQAEGVSSFMTLLAAFEVLLHRLSGQDDILVGTPIAGRNRAEIEGLIGFFINTLVIRTQFAGSPTFQDVLNQVRTATLEAHAHQDMPFEQLVKELDPQRDLNRTPLFQVFFNHQKLESPHIEIPGLSIEAFGDFDSESKFDLTIYVVEQSNSIQLILHYNADLFDENRMAFLLEQYTGLLDQICNNPKRPVDEYSLVTASMRSLIPDPALALEIQPSGLICSMFLEQAVRSPDRLAVKDENSQWTYGQLAHLSANIASWLRERNVSSGDIVAIYGHRSAPFISALLGVLRAGAAFYILDPTYPVARLESCLREAKPKAWLQIAEAGNPPSTLLTMAHELSEGRCLMLPRATEAWSTSEMIATHCPEPDVDLDRPAYVSFTSGTTGSPKCILSTHRPLCHFLNWHIHQFGLKESDRFSMLSGLAHDPLLRDIFTPLSLGATLYIPGLNDILTSGQLFKWMQQHQITVSHLTPAIATLLAEPDDTCVAGGGVQLSLPALRYAFFGGDLLKRSDVALVSRIAPQVECINFYGATETPQAMAWYTINPAEARQWDPGASHTAHPIPIGRPIADTQILITNSTGNQAGIGELGEILIRTPYLSQGYVNDEVLTRERFLINPFTCERNDRLYRTGDLGRYRADGLVEFVGRSDRQVKIRGFRIEPGEIESALCSHPSVKNCLIIAREDKRDGKFLVAYLILENAHRTSPEEFHRYLKNFLPNYMIPSTFVSLDAFPLTPNGKVDIQALPTPNEYRAESATGYVSPRGPIENQIAGIWCECLGIGKASVFDNFFESGGHSITAAQLISRLRSVFHLDLPLHSLFLEPTIAGLSRHIRYDTAAYCYRYMSDMPKLDCLLPVQPKGSRHPFCLVAGYHEQDEPLLIISNLIPHLGHEQPVYGFRPRWLDGKREGYSSIEEMAREFLAELRTQQPEGPYLLGGDCIGGLVAFEMAQQLLHEGEKVGLLALLDSERPNAWRDFFARLRQAGRRAKHIADTLGEIIHPDQRPRRHVIMDLVRRKLGTSHLGAVSETPLDRIYRMRIGYRHMAYRYRPKPYPGRITLVLVENLHRWQKDMGWEEIAKGGLIIHTMPGSHFARLRTHARELGEILTACLNQAEADHVRGNGSPEIFEKI